MLSFRNFYEFFGSGATDGADEIIGKFVSCDGKNTIVASVFFHGIHTSQSWQLLQSPVKVSWQLCT